MTIQLVFQVVAFVLFVAATFGIKLGRFELVPAGLALWLLSIIWPW